MYVCTYVREWVLYTYVCLICTYVPLRSSTHNIWEHVCMYVRMYVCTGVGSIYVCMFNMHVRTLEIKYMGKYVRM